MSDIKKLEFNQKKEHAVACQEFFDSGYKDGTQDAHKMSNSDINEFQRTDEREQIDLFKRFASRQLIEKMERLFGKGFDDIGDPLFSTLNHEVYIYVYCVGWAHGVRQYLESSQR